MAICVQGAALARGGLVRSLAACAVACLSSLSSITSAQCVEQWRPIVPGLPGPVVAATLDDPDGAGPNPGRIVMISGGKLCQWDGNAITILSNEIIGTGFGNGVAVYNGEIYVAGFFTAIGSVSARGIARFSGGVWRDVNSSTSGINFITGGFSPDYNLAVYNGELYFGGGFSVSGGAPSDRIARWNGTSWSAVGTGLTGFGVLSLRVIGGELYVGGEHTGATGVPGTAYLAKWNGNSWLPTNLPFGQYTYVATLGDFSGTPYIFGALYYPGTTVLMGGIARKTATSWEIAPGGAVGAGPNPWVSAMTTYHNKLAVAGLFVNAGPIGAANDIAFYNGSAWSRMLGGIGVVSNNNSVSAVVVYNDELHAFGNFRQVNGAPQDYWARWYDGPPLFTDEPDSSYLTICDATKSFGVVATAANTYRWRRNGVPIFDGPTGNGGTYAGADTATLTIHGPSQFDAGAFDCLATNSCGSRDSADAQLIACAIDINCDGFIDFTDFDGFVSAFEAGAAIADFNGDGFLDFTDFDAFVAAFEAGC